MHRKPRSSRLLYPYLLFAGIFVFSQVTGATGQDLLIPLPGRKQPGAQTGQKTQQQPRRPADGTIIPLPAEGYGQSDTGSQPRQTSDPNLLIPLPKGMTRDQGQPRQPEVRINIPRVPGDSNLSIPGELVIPSEPQQPVFTQPMQQQAQQSQGGTLPLFPKDTSSALFMVMKTWECQDYDGKILIRHAAKVYGEAAFDEFRVEGLDALPEFRLTLHEEHVTFDELLDVISHNTGYDWGVDIPQRVIYIYPTIQQPIY